MQTYSPAGPAAPASAGAAGAGGGAGAGAAAAGPVGGGAPGGVGAISLGCCALGGPAGSGQEGKNTLITKRGQPRSLCARPRPAAKPGRQPAVTVIATHLHPARVALRRAGARPARPCCLAAHDHLHQQHRHPGESAAAAAGAAGPPSQGPGPPSSAKLATGTQQTHHPPQGAPHLRSCRRCRARRPCHARLHRGRPCARLHARGSRRHAASARTSAPRGGAATCAEA
jgi:hypothetical protein